MFVGERNSSSQHTHHSRPISLNDDKQRLYQNIKDVEGQDLNIKMDAVVDFALSLSLPLLKQVRDDLS